VALGRFGKADDQMLGLLLTPGEWFNDVVPERVQFAADTQKSAPEPVPILPIVS